MTTPPTIYMIRHGEKPPADAVGLSAAEDGHEDRPYLTVLPLADSLTLTKENKKFDYRFKRGDSEDVANAVNNFQGEGNILICWEHKALTDLAGAIGVTNPPKYDGDHFDFLWTLSADRTAIVDPTATYSIPPDPNAATLETDGSR